MKNTNQSLLQHICSRFRSTTCIPTTQVRHNIRLYRALMNEYRCGKINDEQFAQCSLRIIQKLRTDQQAAKIISQYISDLNQN